MAERVYGSARVVVTLEIDAPGSWGMDCQLDQLFKQGSESALNALHSVITGIGMPRIKIIGEPKVTAVMYRGNSDGQ